MASNCCRLQQDWLVIINNFSADNDVALRKRAVIIIEQIRTREAYDTYKTTVFNSKAPPPSIRPFQTPVIDFKATSYEKMTEIRSFKGRYDGSDAPKLFKFRTFSIGSKSSRDTWRQLTEPPLTKRLTMDEVRHFIDTPFTSGYPCHTQAVEHGVAAVSRAVKRRRTERTQLIQLRQSEAAIRANPGPITSRKRKLRSEA